MVHYLIFKIKYVYASMLSKSTYLHQDSLHFMGDNLYDLENIIFRERFVCTHTGFYQLHGRDEMFV